MKMKFRIAEWQWEDNYPGLWEQPNKNTIGKEMLISANILNASEFKLQKNNEKLLKNIKEADYVVKGEIKKITSVTGGPTVIIDCGALVNVSVKNFNLKQGDFVEFTATILGEWTNDLLGSEGTKIKILSVEPKKEMREILVSHSNKPNTKETREIKYIILEGNVVTSYPVGG